MDAIYTRKLGVRSCPKNHTFYACEEHRRYLEEGDGYYFVLATEPLREIEQVDADDDPVECDYCKEG